jgi:hypothetical protein
MSFCDRVPSAAGQLALIGGDLPETEVDRVAHGQGSRLQLSQYQELGDAWVMTIQASKSRQTAQDPWLDRRAMVGWVVVLWLPLALALGECG